MSKVGIFGGTFDPIHNGHLITAQYVLEERKLDNIIFMPNNVSPHKIGIKSASTADRLEMLKLAVEPNPAFKYSTYEIEKGDVSYTVNTLRDLKSEYENIELIIGLDNLLVFDEWYEPDEIAELAQLIVLKRESELSNEPNRFFEIAKLINTPVIEISSTEIRQRVERKLPIDFLVPEKVKEYILDKKLYQS
jgi:nicotinate-nucleotide adenylyltransferase